MISKPFLIRFYTYLFIVFGFLFVHHMDLHCFTIFLLSLFEWIDLNKYLWTLLLHLHLFFTLNRIITSSFQCHCILLLCLKLELLTPCLLLDLCPISNKLISLVKVITNLFGHIGHEIIQIRTVISILNLIPRKLFIVLLYHYRFIDICNRHFCVC